MRFRILLVITPLLSPLTTFAQYHGGPDDGTASSGVNAQNAFPNIYSGGGDDGHASAATFSQNPLANIYNGGVNDGVALANAAGQNTLANIYTGGIDDGAATAIVTSQNALSEIYTGGIADGVAIAGVTGVNTLENIYTGGANDGTATAFTTAENPLAEIYAGGAADGVAMGFALNQNHINPLPVALLEFTGAWYNDDAVLGWETGSETSLDHFVLERSDDGGIAFSAIATIAPGPGHDYRYTDAQAYRLPPEVLLYRLKSIAKSGAAAYSAIVKLGKDKAAPVIVAYPNPTSGRFTLSIMNVADVVGYDYLITGMDGKIIRRGAVQAAVSSFDLAGYAAGTYHLVLFKEGKSIQQFTILLNP